MDEASRLAVFNEGMTLISAVFRGGAWEPDVLAIYWRIVGNFDSSKIFAGFEEAIKNERYLPSPATLRQYVGGAHTTGAKDVVPAYQTPWHIKRANDRDPATRAEAQRQSEHIRAMIADLKSKFANGPL
jgi:hypothetical protein